MIYFAHRGASAKEVQNTLPAFEQARKDGATCYELDVHLTQDGALVVHHDYTLLQTAGIDVEIGALSRADFKKQPLKNPFSNHPVFVPELREIFPIVRPELDLLNLELKNDDNRYPGLEEKTLQAVRAAGPDIYAKTLFSSFDYKTLVRLRELDKNARIGLLTRSFALSEAVALGAESVHLNHTRFTPEIVEKCHSRGIKVYVYTVNDRGHALLLVAMGADGIFTDQVDQFV